VRGGKMEGPLLGGGGGLAGEVDEEAAGELEAGAGGVLVGVLEGGGEFALFEGTIEGAGFDVGVLDASPFAIRGGEDVVGAEEAGNFGGGRGYGDFRGRAGLDDVAFAHHQHVGAEGVGFVKVVGDEEDGRFHFGQQGVELLPEGGVEAAGGFVQ